MTFVVTALVVVAGYFAWMRYQSTDDWRWLAGIGCIVICGLVATAALRDGPVSWAGDDTECIHFRGNECF